MERRTLFERTPGVRGMTLIGAVILPVVALACGDRPGLVRVPMTLSAAIANPQVLSQPGTASLASQDSRDNPGDRKQAIVGTWIADWYVGNTTQLYDRVITVFHADGNETENDIAVPPATENHCYGVWEQTDRDTFKMRHVGWVFDLNGVFMGFVEVIATASVTDHGTRFRGKYVLEQYDLNGNIIPADHAEGEIKAIRYTVANGIVNIWKANP